MKHFAKVSALFISYLLRVLLLQRAVYYKTTGSESPENEGGVGQRGSLVWLRFWAKVLWWNLETEYNF